MVSSDIWAMLVGLFQPRLTSSFESARPLRIASSRPSIFSRASFSAVPAASKALQRAIGVKDDGAIGPISLAALKAVNNTAALFYRVKCERYELLLRFIGSDAEEAAFAIGWSNRLDQFEHPL